MATIEKNTLLCGKDASGNLLLLYPVTMADNVEGLEELLALKAAKPTATASTLAASKWSNGQYSFEATYPSASYDLDVQLANTATAEQIGAFGAAVLVGNINSNILTAKGNVPTVDIPIILKAVKKI